MDLDENDISKISNDIFGENQHENLNQEEVSLDESVRQDQEKDIEEEIYSRINVRVVLVGIEIWSDKDKVARTSSLSNPLLEDFRMYKRDTLRQKFKGHDNAQLICKDAWDDAGGLAVLFEMCKDTSSSIVAWNPYSIVGPWIASAHEMGHNLGMDHDEEIGHCTCLTPRGCIMGGHKSRIAGFSDCSLEALQKLDDYCLYDLPSKEVKSKCGNGIVEEGEECDCGNEKNCEEKDKCCEPRGCKLKKGSQCSDFNHPCCHQCLFKPQAEVCRPPKGQCDVAEHCSGNSGECPEDDFRRNGEPCNSEKQIIQGVPYYGESYQNIFNPPITARYVRINPSHWNDKKCLTAELYGCSADQASSNNNTKTPLSTEGFCIKPQNGGCRPRDGTDLTLTKTTDCEKEEMEFTLSADGVLRHACSNSLVCPANSKNEANTLLVISGKCTVSQATFERTKGCSLKHKASGMCIHPYNGGKQEGSKLCIYTGCDEERLRINFLKQDCLLPLGMASGKIKDDQITASSFIENKQAKFARPIPGTNNSWCALGGKAEYLQIDLAQTSTVTAIQLGGLFWDYVQGYYVHYSQDGQDWNIYTEMPDSSGFNSYCYMGKCAETRTTQCADLWGPGGLSADKACYDKYNKEGKSYGTCNPSRKTRCKSGDVLCGQIQCLEKYNDKPYIDYGTNYRRVDLPGGEQCSVASLKTADVIGIGMVKDGTKCGSDKACLGYKCQSFSKKTCQKVNGKECAGNGLCSNQGKCVCDEGYSPDSSCSKAVSPVNGGWGSWSSWSECSRLCNGGTRVRFRYCDNPKPKYGGEMCKNERVIEEECNTEKCPEAHSCRHLQQIGNATNRVYKDTFYKINPDGKGPVMTYCDMSRDGGGWTLLITSFTNTWTNSTVKKKNEQKPSLKKDFSILYRANDIKDSMNVQGDYFEYRIEANKFGRWGGVWKAPRSYSFVATDNDQTNVDLVTKFDDWEYDYGGIEKRMPYLYGARLTLTISPQSIEYGSITANLKKFHPAPWMYEGESQPAYIWYWMREGEYKEPKSCMDILTRSLSKPARAQDGVYTIKVGDKQVKTYCDMTRNGGAWTLLLTSVSQSGWTGSSIKERNTDKPSLNSDYSILGVSDHITGAREFQYRIEADGEDNWGGIWESPNGYSLSGTSDQNTNIKLLQKFGNWDENDSNLNKRIPYIKQSKSYTTSDSGEDSDGTILGGTSDGVYIQNGKPKPKMVRVWVREGTSRSCFQIKARGEGQGLKFMDGVYMIKLQENQVYLPVYCDMTSEPGAYTLLVTSANGNWRVDDVKQRNINTPSLSNDYSILGMADSIKDTSSSKTFRYKLEANERGQWGGIWEAPIEYSFVKLDHTQDNVRLIKRLGEWKTSEDTIQNRMPYLGQSKSLLTTNDYSDWYGSGTIISDNNDLKPAAWIYTDMHEPGVIWYWMNEDDCDNTRKPVNGGVSGWSSWGSCDQLCKKGKQRRHKQCDNPKPRCGGNPCDAKQMAEETKDCYTCPESPIRSSTKLCVQPKANGCSFRDGSALVYAKGPADCSKENQAFVYGNNSVLIHKCSEKMVCPKGDLNNLIGAALMLSSRCDEKQATFVRTRLKSLKHAASGLCVNPQEGVSEPGRTLVLWDTCDEERLKHELFKLN